MAANGSYLSRKLLCAVADWSCKQPQCVRLLPVSINRTVSWVSPVQHESKTNPSGYPTDGRAFRLLILSISHRSCSVLKRSTASIYGYERCCHSLVSSPQIRQSFSITSPLYYCFFTNPFQCTLLICLRHRPMRGFLIYTVS